VTGRAPVRDPRSHRRGYPGFHTPRNTRAKQDAKMDIKVVKDMLYSPLRKSRDHHQIQCSAYGHCYHQTPSESTWLDSVAGPPDIG